MQVPLEITSEDFDPARRPLQDRQRRSAAGRVKVPARAPHGWVGRLAPADGFGFIETADGREVYFHRSAVLDEGFDRLTVGAEVRFTEGESDNGPRASLVRLVAHGARAPRPGR